MIVHGYELLGEWKNSTSGKIARAKKGGKLYFLKKYQTPVAPINNGTLDPKTFAHNKKQFEQFFDRRKRVNATIRSIAGEGGNIIIPSEEFIDGNQLVEASEFVEGVVPDDELEGVLDSLSTDVKKLLMQTAAGALYSIHSKHIVHSDLKPKNVLLVRNKTGNYVAKLVDFDSSYFTDDIPEELVGTIDYYSPELGLCSAAEDDREELEKKLTEKSDIFSLGLIFHYYLSGALPTPVALTEKLRKRQEKGKVIYCWVALSSGCELMISPAIKNPKYISLIGDMLKLDPDERPSASDVLKRLREEPVIEEPWPDHSVILDKNKLKSSNIVGLKKVAVSGQKKYELLLNSGEKKILSKEDLMSLRYCRAAAPDSFCMPWEEHGMTFDLERIRSRGFVSGEQKIVGGVKGYSFYRSDSTSSFFRREMLLAMKYAKETVAPIPSPSPSEFAEPWPEHRIVFDEDAIKRRGYISVERQTLGGVNGYSFTRSTGVKQFIRVEMAIIQKMAQKA